MNIVTDILFNATLIEKNTDVWSGNNVAGNIRFCLLTNLGNDNGIDGATGKMITFEELYLTFLLIKQLTST